MGKFILVERLCMCVEGHMEVNLPFLNNLMKLKVNIQYK